MKDVAKMSRFPSQIEIIMKALKKCHGSRRLTGKNGKSIGIYMNISKNKVAHSNGISDPTRSGSFRITQIILNTTSPIGDRHLH